ncbi:uncharacterized protein LOC112638669 [Camponotus floridanus]|uniref:uncharacterized protein LOC112638669 n=1 Tax=Camponotus floridanus TaxID=104421 RepID=UPI000DC6B043|nr:uncharacterized protein LOC112638669 [Camponotus floridanus]
MNTRPWGQCPLFAEAPIFGKTKLYWDEWKKQWNARLDEWAAQAAAQEQVSLESISNDTRSRNDLEDENEITGSLQRKVSELRKRHDSDASASRLALLNLSEHQPNRTQKRDADKQRHQRRVSIQLPDRLKATKASRARYRAKNDDASRPQVDMKILSKDSPALGEAVSEDRDKEMIEQQEHESSEIATVKPQNTARERRRERFNVDLK